MKLQWLSSSLSQMRTKNPKSDLYITPKTMQQLSSSACNCKWTSDPWSRRNPSERRPCTMWTLILKQTFCFCPALPCPIQNKLEEKKPLKLKPQPTAVLPWMGIVPLCGGGSGLLITTNGHPGRPVMNPSETINNNSQKNNSSLVYSESLTVGRKSGFN